MTNLNIYDSATIERIKNLVADHTDITSVLDTLVKRLNLSRRQCSRLNKQYGIWGRVGTDKPRDAMVSRLVDLVQKPVKRLFLDLETSPNVVLSWRVGYKINLDYSNILKERAIICACYKWEGESKVNYLTWDANQCDKNLLAKLIEVVNQADEVVGHNIARFDLPWVRTRCLFHGLPPLADHKIIDTLKWGRSKFYFNSNKLDYIAKYLGLGGKIKTEFSLWKEIVLNKSSKAMSLMVKYCCRDVEILERVWFKLSKSMPAKTHAGVASGQERWTCPRDGSSNVVINRRLISAAGIVTHKMQCKDCGGYYSISDTTFQEYLAYKKLKIANQFGLTST